MPICTLRAMSNQITSTPQNKQSDTISWPILPHQLVNHAVKRAHTQHLVQIFVESFGLVRGGEGIKPGIGLRKLKICTRPAARPHGAASRSRFAIFLSEPSSRSHADAGASPHACEQRPSLSPPRRGPLHPS
jgi:hypothetical protein